MKPVQILLFTICFSLAASCAHAEFKLTRAGKLGMSAERLQRVDAVADRYVDEGRVTGIVTVVSRYGKPVQSAVEGTMGMDNPAPMQVDSLFRIYSMTKAITAVGALILYEEGHFHLDDPVAKFLPAFENVTVVSEEGDRPATRPMTIHHLFTHMSGLHYGYADPDLRSSADLQGFVQQLATHPLAFEPGTEWRYGYSTDVLGAVIEVISGQPLGVFLQERVFAPLGMEDTFFEVPADKLHRLTSNHAWDRDKDAMQLVSGGPFTTGYRVAPFDSGGGGLISTAPDYLRFLEMLRREGLAGSTRLLGTKTVKFMATDHLPKSITDANIGPDHDPMLGLGGGHGLGIGVYIDPVRRGVLSSRGELDWGGAAGTIYWLDPVEDVIVIGMIQLFGSPWRLRDDLSVGVYQSLTESHE